jgi:hypothetical protein
MDRAGEKFLRAALVVAGVIAAVLAAMAALLGVYAVVVYGANAVLSLPLLALVLFAVALVMYRTRKKSIGGDTSVDDRLSCSPDYETRGGLKSWGQVTGKPGTKPLREYLVIAAAIAIAMYFVLIPLLPLLALILLPLALVMDIAVKKFPRASMVVAAVSAIVFYVADAFSFFLPPWALLLLAMVLYFLPAALWALRTDHRVARFRAVKATIYCVAAVSTVLTIDLQNRMADRRAVKLGDACLAYRTKYHHYPKELEALVPEFISSVPPPRYSLPPTDSFRYFSDAGQEEPMLWYEVFPLFGRRFYHMESRKWGFMD